MGSPRYPTQSQIEELKKAAELPAPEAREVKSGELTLTLASYGLAVIELKQETKTRAMAFYGRTTRREMMRRCGVGLLASPLLTLWSCQKNNSSTSSNLGLPYQG